ncbi:CoA transferase [Granulicoccus phenolivorans]|uniref:CoA transferase n=1 Tax=Granulicoccus phenolivorans TaxID=266854 RepID=UPI000413F232|nr:CoA transferase [Granulicoccus phenolivorans]
MSGPTVLNLGHGLPTAVACRLLAGAGARILRVSDPTDDAVLARYPALRHWWDGWETLTPEQARVAGADVVLTGGETIVGALEHEVPSDPGQVVIEVAAYVPGTTDQTPADDLLVQARTGFVFEQFADRPTQIAFGSTLYGAGLLATLAAWAGLLQRRRTGAGALARVSLQQGQALFWPHLWMSAQRPTPDFDKVPPLDVRHLIFRCRDGRYVQFVMGVPGAVAKVHRALEIPGEVDPADRGVPDASRGADSYFGDRPLLAEYVARLDSDVVVARLKAAGIAAEPVLAPGAALQDPQVRQQGLVETDRTGRLRVAQPLRYRARAAAPAPTEAVAGPDPLSGVRIVDIGNWVAGPFASKLLADLGAEVISVDPPTGLSNLTGMRNVLATNRGKRSVVLDLKTEAGRAQLHRLLEDADVLMHNMRVGAAERLGLGPDQVRERHPGLVYLQTTAYGDSGPKALDSGFDMVMQALCGHEQRAGGRGNEPVWYRSPFVDYASGALGAIGILAGLYRRATDQVGVDVHVSLLAAALFLRGEGDLRGAEGADALDGERLGFAPLERLYRTRDGWVALVLREPATRTAWAALLGLDPATDVRDEAWTRAGTAWTAERDSTAVVTAVEEIGGWAVPARRDAFARLLDDPAARAAHLVIDTEDKRFGVVTGCYGPLVNLEGWAPARPFRPAPVLGEHNDELLQHESEMTA